MPNDIHARLKRLQKAGRLRRRRKKLIASRPASMAKPERAPEPQSEKKALTEVPGMSEVEGRWGRYLLRTRRFPLEHQQGSVSLGELLHLPDEAVQLLVDAADFDFRETIFLDTETTGLSGGTGVIVFLTGVGVFEEDGFVVRQFFARNPAEERAYLPDLAQFIQDRKGLVTFNGRSFDWPLLRTRFTLTGLPAPSADPHLDLLIPARRLWRTRLRACHFGNLEKRILGHVRAGLDIPSWAIPNLWFRFAKGEGNTHDMEAILYHNQEDILSMAPLAQAIIATMAGIKTPHPHDWLALARIYQRSGHDARAERAYRQALDQPLPPSLRMQAMHELARLLKRQGRWKEAVHWWLTLASAQPHNVDALIELAKYYEWRQKELELARHVTLEAIQRVRGWRSTPQQQRLLRELEHRLARLERKLAQ